MGSTSITWFLVSEALCTHRDSELELPGRIPWKGHLVEWLAQKEGCSG